MSWWLAPGIALVVAGFALQVGSFLRRPRPMQWVRTAIRLRFLGIGALLLGAGFNVMSSALEEEFDVGAVLIGLFLIAMGGTWFYAATTGSSAATWARSGLENHGRVRIDLTTIMNPCYEAPHRSRREGRPSDCC